MLLLTFSLVCLIAATLCFPSGRFGDGGDEAASYYNDDDYSTYGSDIDAFEQNYDDAIESSSSYINPDENIYTGSRVPRFYQPISPEQDIPRPVVVDWSPTDFNVFNIRKQEHRSVLDAHDDRPGYLLNPYAFTPERHNRALRRHIKQYREGNMSLKMLVQKTEDDVAFLEAVKHICARLGVVYAPMKAHLYYSNQLSIGEALDIYNAGQARTLSMGPRPDYKWSFV